MPKIYYLRILHKLKRTSQKFLNSFKEDKYVHHKHHSNIKIRLDVTHALIKTQFLIINRKAAQNAPKKHNMIKIIQNAEELYI